MCVNTFFEKNFLVSQSENVAWHLQPSFAYECVAYGVGVRGEGPP